MTAQSASSSGMTLRSVVFNLAFYAVVVLYLIFGLPLVLFPRRAMLGLAKFWGLTNRWLLRTICGIGTEWRGREKIPSGPLIVAAKHQSAWETFALLALFDDPTFIVKRELMWIPLFGWYMRKAGMIPVDRGAGLQALAAMARRVRREIERGRQIIIFPEGTRRAPGAAPAYQPGVAKLYAAAGVACLPIALNSGLVWPRRAFRRYPGIVRVEVLDTIPPGLRPREFLGVLQDRIEAATARLIEEGAGDVQRRHNAGGCAS
jgi:1-acyl-sn-glycerol-3-phosphate acyltransferase